jgi:hypothetical protein
MSIEAKAQIELILKNCNINYRAVHTGQTTRDDKWECDAWRIQFSTFRGELQIIQKFEFYTGLGHRVPDPSALAKQSAKALQNVSKRMLAWSDHYKQHPDKVVPPHAADVLYSLILDSSAAKQSFNSWCDDYGYDTDSRKALNTYELCQENADKLSRVFDAIALETIEEALQDY